MSRAVVESLLEADVSAWRSVAAWALSDDDGPRSAVDELAVATRALAEQLAGELDDDPAASLCALLERQGAAGREQAGRIRERPANLWTDPERTPEGQRWVRVLARVAWRTRLEPSGGSGPPATLLRLAQGLASARRGVVRDGRLLDDEGREGALVPTAPADLASGIGSEGLAHLGGVTFHRLIRWMILQAHEHGTDRRVVIPGGVAALTDRIGAAAGKARDEVRELLGTLQATTIRWDGPAGYGGASLLPWYHVTPAAPGRPAVLELKLSPLFEPRLVNRLVRGHPDRALVPILPLPRIPLNPRLHPAAARLDWLALVALRSDVADLVERGGVRLDWPALAREAGLPVEHLPALLEAWTTSAPGFPARWREAGSRRWTLAESDEPTRAALRFLSEAGQRTVEGRAGGRKAARRRKRKARG